MANEIKMSVTIRVDNAGADLNWTPKTFQLDQSEQGIDHQTLKLTSTPTTLTTSVPIPYFLAIRHISGDSAVVTVNGEITGYISTPGVPFFFIPTNGSATYTVAASPTNSIVEVIWAEQ